MFSDKLSENIKNKDCFFFSSLSFDFPFFLFWLITDNKSLNSTDPNIKPKVWVETGQMHQRSDNAVDHNENLILDDNNEVRI